MLTKTCQYCKKEFRAKNERAKYCSMSCMAKAFKGRKMSKKTRTYKRIIKEKSLSSELEKQLRLLETLKSNGLISEKEYQERKEKLLLQNK